MSVLSILKPLSGWIGLIAFSVYAWKKYLDIRSCNNKILERRIDKAVVMYSKEHGICGWPVSNLQPCNYVDFKEIQKAYIPITNFIDTAEETIDIAIMVISSFVLVDSLVKALERGVYVRLIVDYNDNNKSYKKLLNLGAEIVFFIDSDETISSIFHYKYAIKDFGTSNQVLYCGSLNWTDGGFQSNYEDVTFITNAMAIEAFQENFEETVSYIKEINTSNAYNKLMISAFSTH